MPYSKKSDDGKRIAELLSVFNLIKASANYSGPIKHFVNNTLVNDASVWFDKDLAKFPKLRHWLGKDMSWEAIDPKLERFAAIREFVGQLITDAKWYRKAIETGSKQPWMRRPVPARFIVWKVNAKDKLTPDKLVGKIQFELDPILATLELADIDRFRLCPICDQAFYAKQTRSKACSPECTNANRQSEYRKKLKRDEMNEARIWKRERDKKRGKK